MLPATIRRRRIDPFDVSDAPKTVTQTYLGVADAKRAGPESPSRFIP
jgi:hypothetical protein